MRTNFPTFSHFFPLIPHIAHSVKARSSKAPVAITRLFIKINKQIRRIKKDTADRNRNARKKYSALFH